MVDVTTILIGAIFLIVIIIFIVYFVYYNRVIRPTSVITDNGISLTSVNNPNLLITDQTIRFSSPVSGVRNIMVLQNASGKLPSSSQGWIFLNENQQEITAFAQIIPTNGQPDPNAIVVKSGAKVFIRAAYTGGYVRYSSNDTNIYTDGLEISEATPFFIEFNVVDQILSLQSTLTPGQYVIPSNIDQFSGNVIMGLPSNDSDKNWFINKQPS